MASSLRSFFEYVLATLYLCSGLWLLQPQYKRVGAWLSSFRGNGEVERLQKCLHSARTYDEWLGIAQVLDQHFPENRRWKLDSKSRLYNWEQIQTRINDIQVAIADENRNDAFNLLQFGMVRGLGNIADPRLYNRLYAGTKLLIEDYISVMLGLIDRWFETPWRGVELPLQQKLDQAERFRTAFGKTALVLQGGSIFGMYHIGVMKALHERQLLPRVILGTSTGAIMAALVGTHADEELPHLFQGRGINLDAFALRGHDLPAKWYDVLLIMYNRLRRFYRSGYVLDREALERCVEDNVGDMTFREAHDRTGRIISITIECDSPGTPNLLNYLTTPNVLIRTAAMASNESDPDIAPAMIRQKNRRGEILPWSLNDETPSFRILRRKRGPRKAYKDEINAPLQRISQLENINHFIISQARPYLVPFLAPSMHRSNTPRSSRAGFWSLQRLKEYAIRTVGKELAHRMNQIDRIWGLPRRVRRFLMDEKIPFRSITVVPEIDTADFLRLLRNPSTEEIDHWIKVGERSVWPCVSALQVRCAIEFDLDNRYKLERRRPMDQIYAQERAMGNSSRRRTRVRSDSAESNPV